MNDEERMKLSNPNKHLLSKGDICISKTFGIGFIDEIETPGCWYPVSVRFFQQIWIFGKLETKYKFCCYNTLGQYSKYTSNPNGVIPCPFTLKNDNYKPL